MRSSIVSRPGAARRLSRFLNLLCAALLCCGMIPVAAYAAPSSLELIPEGSQGAARVVSGAEGGVGSFSHCAADVLPSVDAGSAATSSGTVEDTEDPDPASNPAFGGASRISEDVPLGLGIREFSEVEPTDGSGFDGEDAVDEGAVGEGGPVEEETDDDAIGFEAEQRALYGEAATHNVYFEANGGDYVPAGFYTASVGGEMPDISGALLANPPYRYGCTFLGFYDGSDPTRAKKYYNKDFQVDDTCDGKRYPADAEGLTLYAGFAPILKVDVPGSVSIAVGTVPEIAGPTVAPLEIVNESVWPVEFTSLAWETEGQSIETSVTEADVLAASQFVSNILAKEVTLTPSTISEMFTTPETLSLVISTPDGGEVRVPYGGAAVDLAKGESNPLRLAAAPTLPSESAGASTLPLNITIDMGSSAVKNAEKVSKTRLLSSYRASSWDAAPQSYVMFDLRGGEGGQADSLPVTYGEVLPALDVTSEPTLEGHIFQGYYDDDDTCWYAPDGTGSVIPVAGKTWDKASAAVLHAEWRTRDCTVELVAGPEGSSAQVERGQRVVTRNVAYNEPLSSVFGRALPTPQWIADGQRYVFDGWYLADGTEATVDTVITDYAGKTTLTAHWIGVPVTVTWNTEAEGVTVDAWTNHPSGTELSELPVPVRPGYTFAGWYTRSGGEGVPVTAKTVIFEDAAFYARWNANTIGVTFELDGTAYTATAPYAANAKLPIPAGLPANPVKAGYDFLGWYEVLEDGTLAESPLNLQAANVLPSHDVTYRGRWAGKTIELSWNAAANGGAWTGAATTTQIYEEGAMVAVPEGAPTKTGFAFMGWWTAPDGGTRIDGADSYPLPVENTTFYARFVDRPTSVSFDLDGGSWNMPTGVTVKASVDKDMPTIASGDVTATAPTKEGYDFEGFYLGDVCYYGSDLTSVQRWTLGDETVKLTAKWTPWTRTVIFAANGGDNPDQMGTVTWDAPADFVTTEPVHANGPFLGWSLRAAALRADVPDAVTTYTLAQLKALCDAADEVFPAEGESLTLYAVYGLPMHPKDDLEDLGEGGDDFYLELMEDDVKKDERIPADAWGFYGLDDIEHAANDIAENKTDSEYYPFMKALMDNDIQFTTGWKYFEYDNAATPIKRLETTAKDESGQDKTIPYKVRIIGLLHDDLASAKTVDGSTIDKAGITFQFVDLMYNTYQMNESIVASKSWVATRLKNPYNYGLFDSESSHNTNSGGWGRSELRANMNPGIDSDLNAYSTDTNAVWDLAPENLRSALVPVNKKYYAGTSAISFGVTSESTDYMFVPSYSELVKPGTYYDASWTNLQKEGTVYRFYENAGVMGNRGDDYAPNKVLLKYHILENGSIDTKTLYPNYMENNSVWGGYNSWEWWERSASTVGAVYFMHGSYAGFAYGSNAYSTFFNGISPAFCMGSGIVEGDEVAITYDANGGAFAGGERTKTVTSVYGKPLTTIEEKPTRPGYTFEGWGALPEQTPRGNATYRAVWTPCTYDLTFNANGGGGTMPIDAEVTYGSPGYVLPDACFPYKVGSRWLGWSFDDDAAEPDFLRGDAVTAEDIVAANGGDIPETGSSFTLYAVYTAPALDVHPTLPDSETGFYLHITSTEANKAGLSDDSIGYYYVGDIKAAADDISEKATTSEYYDMFNRILANDIQFTTNWKYYEYVESDTNRVLGDDENTRLSNTTVTRASEPAKNGDDTYKTIPYKVRLIGINHDDLAEARTAESGATVSKAGFTFQFVNLLYNTYQMNDNSTNYVTSPARQHYPYNYVLYSESGNTNQGGWGETDLRENMNSEKGTVYSLAPDELKDALVRVNKKFYASTSAISSGVTSESPDYMFVPSYSELVLPETPYTDWNGLLSPNEGDQYAFYRAKGVRGDKVALKVPGDPNNNIDYADNMALVKFHVLPNGNVKEGDETIDKKILRTYYGNGSDYDWWTAAYSWNWWERSPSPTSATSFAHVDFNGFAWHGNDYSSYFTGVSPCFCF